VRASVIMGFVGAGGLGQLMDQSMKMLNGGEAATIPARLPAAGGARRRPQRDAAQGAGMNARETRDTCSPRGAGDFCLSCVLTSGLLVTAVVASFAYLEIDFAALFAADSATAMARFAASFFPPDLAPDFLQKTAHGALQTFAVAMIGTLLAALAGAAAGAAGCRPPWDCRWPVVTFPAQPAAQRARAGVGDADGPRRRTRPPSRAYWRWPFIPPVSSAGCSPKRSRTRRHSPSRACVKRAAAASAPFLYGTQPLVWPQCVAYGLYRLEMNIRMAAVLGFVGAGGLGQMLYYHLSIFQQAQAATVLIAMFVLVLAVDMLSDRLRTRMARS
jgi:phosphonate transport system permease protein